MRLRPGIALLALVVLGCGGATPSPSAVATTPPSPTTVPTVAATPTAVPVATASPAPPVPDGYVRVTFRIMPTGGGAGVATLGVLANESGKDDNAPLILCAPVGNVPACRQGGSFEATLDFRTGATVEYVWFQRLAPDGSNDLLFHRNMFVASPAITEREITYDIQA